MYILQKKLKGMQNSFHIELLEVFLPLRILL